MSDPYDLANGDSPRSRPGGGWSGGAGGAGGSRGGAGGAGPGGGAWGQPVVPYATPTTQFLKPLGGIASATTVVGYGIAALLLARIPLLLWEWWILGAAAADTLTEDQELAWGIAAILIGLGYIALFIAFVIVFLIWHYRAVRNIRQMTGGSRYGPGLSVGCWFIPFANLVMPYYSLKDLYERAVSPSATIVGPYWALFILSGIADRILRRAQAAAELREDWEAAQPFVLAQTIPALATAAAMILLLKIVRDVTNNIGGQDVPPARRWAA